MTDQTTNLPAKAQATSTAVSCKVDRDLSVLRQMPERLNDLQLIEVEAIAKAPVPASAMTDDHHLQDCLAEMDANLQRRAVNEENKVRRRIKAQRRELLALPREQMTFIKIEAIRRFTFFPTIAELLELGKEWKNPHGGAQRLARTMVMHERMRRQREAAKRLKFEEVPQKDIDAWPEWLCEGLVAERLLREREGGGFEQDRRHLDDYLAFLETQGGEND